MDISTSTQVSSLSDRLAAQGNAASARLHKQLKTATRRKSTRRRLVRAGLVAGNVLILAVIVAVVLYRPSASSVADTSSLASASAAAVSANPLDQLSSADIALTVARMSSLPESTAISNQVQSQAADLATAPTTNEAVVSEPQVVTTALKSRADIQEYVAKAGDTVTSIAAKFGVTSDSVRWSNNLSGDTVNAGSKLVIPPVNGIVYTVKAGDTPASLAVKYNASQDQIIAYNDAEISGITPGEQIIIPNAVQPTSQTAATIAGAGTVSGSGFAWGSSPIYGYNGYDYGYCTWYVATQISVPANWGNASTWAFYARLSGWNVGKTPSLGAIAQDGAEVAYGQGHVAIVDAVSPDGSQIEYRDMNGLAGWGRVGQSGWVPANHFDNYISR